MPPRVFGHYHSSRGARKCYYCRLPFNWEAGDGHPEQPTKDHKIPKSRGGAKSKYGRNAVLACFSCNNEKSNLTDKEYFEFRKITKGCKGRKAKWDRWNKHMGKHLPAPEPYWPW